MIQIEVNGEQVELKESLTIKSLLEVQNVRMPEYVTVQINDEIIPRESFETRTLNHGDKVEFIYFMGGGALWISQSSDSKDIPDILF